MNVLVYSFVINEKYIYFWDYSGYWASWINISEIFTKNPSKAMAILWDSIRYSDYNMLPVMMLIPWNILFGDSRVSYILAIANLFAIPSAILILYFIKKNVIHENNKSLILHLFIFMIILLLPQLWIPLLRGEVGVVGIAIIACILIIYFKKPVEDQDFSSIFIIGALLCLLILMRRWYAYWTVSFFISVFVDVLIMEFLKKNYSIKSHFKSLWNVIKIGILSSLLFFFISTPYAMKMLVTDYSDIYSAYKSNDTVWLAFRSFYYSFGPVWVFLSVAGIICSIFIPKLRRISLFLCLQFLTIFTLFSRVQNFGPQHYYLLVSMVLIFVTILLYYIYKFNIVFLVKGILLFSIFIVILLNFSVVFIPYSVNSNMLIKNISSVEKCYPMIRNDINVIYDIYNTLYSISKLDNDRIYVLSSSFIFNDDILKNITLFDRSIPNINDKIFSSNHVDKRDGFPNQFITAKYVLVCSPIQYHLRTSDQRVIGILADQLLNMKLIGRSYRKMDYDFILDSNVHVFVYEKVSPIKQEDLNEIAKIFHSYYPDRIDFFTPKTP